MLGLGELVLAAGKVNLTIQAVEPRPSDSGVSILYLTALLSDSILAPAVGIATMESLGVASFVSVNGSYRVCFRSLALGPATNQNTDAFGRRGRVTGRHRLPAESRYLREACPTLIDAA